MGTFGAGRGALKAPAYHGPSEITRSADADQASHHDQRSFGQTSA
jgi:hypothetical protein